MDVFCINTNNPQFQKLLAESGEKQGVFAMMISKWMTESGIHNRYPTLQELGITAMESAKPGVEELFESNPELASAVYDATIPNRLSEVYKLTDTPIGDPVSQTEGTGLCDGTCGIMAYRLKEQGMPYGTTKIDDKYANYHAIALTEIEGKRFILNQPQLEFMSRSYQKAPVWERAQYWNADNVRMNRHLAELNQFIYGMEIPLFNFFTGKSFESEYGEINPVFKDITKTEKIEDIENPGSGKIEKRTIIYQTAKLISNPKVSVKWSYDKEFPYEESLTDFSSSLEGEEIIAWASNVMKPRLIEATEENLIQEYKLTKEQAKESIKKINSAKIEKGSEENKRITPEQAQQAQQLYSQYLEQGGTQQDIEGFKEFLDKPATSEEIAKESVDVMQKSIQKLEKDGLVDDSRKILKPFDFNAYNEKLTNHARNKYGVTGEGMLFKIVESKSSLPYDRLIGYNKSTFYDVNNELFKELQEKYDAYHSSEGKSGYYQLKDSTNLKQADKELDTYLLDFLKPFGVKSQEVEELKTRLGKDALALTDVLNKVIYHVNSDKLNALSIPEEASHMIVMLMGKHNPLIKELLDNIHKWDKYESIKKLYLPEYQNLAQVKIEAVGQLLSEALVRNNLKPAAKSMFKTIIDNISKWLKEKFSKFQSQLFIADKIAVEVLNGNADFIGNLKPAYPKVDFEKALNGNPLAKKLVTDFTTELKLPLVGSLAIAGQNEAIYRSEKEPVHDLDFLQDGRKTSISRKLDKKLKELNAVEAHKGWPSPDKTYTCFTYFIPAEGYTIIPTNINKNNWVTEFEIHKEGKLFVSLRYYWVKDGKGKLTRTLLTSFENPADSKTDLSQIYMPTDFFFYPKGYSEKTSANNMAHWTSIYNGKMLLSPESRKERMFDRPKDQNDYLLLNPEDRSKKPTEAFMYYQISDEDVIEDLIQEGKLKTKCE